MTRTVAGSTWPDIAALDPRPLLVVPMGAVEQHGPHLPLDTDTRIAVAIAERLLAALGEGEALLAPAIAYGASGEHAGFAGTVSIGHDALTAVIVEVVRSADAFRGVVLVNGHGGNAEALRRAVATSADEGRRVLAWSWTVAGADAHAGRTETSLLLAIAPEAVRLGELAPGNVEPLADLIPHLRVGGVSSVSPSGVLGDPTGASAAEGASLLDAVVADLLAVVADSFPT